MKVSTSTKAFIGLMAAASLFVLFQAFNLHTSVELPRFLAILALTLVAARFKVSLPGLSGSMSVTLPFILVSLIQMSFAETLIITVGSVLVQSWASGRQPKLIQVLFNVCNVANAIGLAYFAIHMGRVQSYAPVAAVLVAVATTVYLLANTLCVAAVIALTESKNFFSVWQEVCLLSFPYYVVSAGLATMVLSINVYFGLESSIAVLPVAFMLFQSYRRFFRAPQKQTSAGLGMVNATAKAAVTNA
jgi:hypothetical protein